MKTAITFVIIAVLASIGFAIGRFAIKSLRSTENIEILSLFDGRAAIAGIVIATIVTLTAMLGANKEKNGA